MKLYFENNHLYLTVFNSVSTHNHPSADIMPYHGIGLKNVQRRLDLLYPGMYELRIKQDDDQFRVNLSLALAAQKIEMLDTAQMV
jgi:LytS/YehU family sensor histidine kinase